MSDVGNRIAKLSPEKRAVLARALAARGAGAAALEPIAIVGLACRFPGGAADDESYWRLLAGRVDAISEVPADRWDSAALYDPDATAAGKIATRWGGFLDAIDRFDPYFFGIAPREASRMDPQQRLWLEVAWEAFEDAGLTSDRLAGSRTGVFLGLHSHSSDYFWLQMNDASRMDAFTGTGNAHNIAAGRLAYLFDLRGPAITVDTACSSSLVAVHMACQSLRSGDSRVAIAGGVNAMLSPIWSIPLSRMQMLSPTGRCRAFDASADGFVRGEGAGAVVLKKLGDAIADGDAIRAVIRGSAVNQDGRTNGITAPNGLSQRALLRDALQNAGVSAADISHVETHGTGTALGDPIELEALADVLQEGRLEGRRCWLGAVKSNFGHLEGAAGVAGLIKVVLSLEKRAIPPIAHYQALNPHIAVDVRRFPIPTEVVDWPDQGGPRLAGVSSFGWSGTNAHVIVEEAPASAGAEDDRASVGHLLPVSARSAEGLVAIAARYRDFLRTQADTNLAAVCATAALRRTHHEHRATVTGRSAGELAEGLDALSRGERRATVATGVKAPGRAPSVVFAFCGQGPQRAGMARELLDTEPVFRESLERCDAAIKALTGWSVIDELVAPAGQSRLENTEVAQPVNFALQVALAALWRAWGIEPAAVVGHSAGEVAAAHVSGMLSLEDASRLAVVRGRLMQAGSGLGRMVSVELPLAEIKKVVSDWTGLSVAAVNGPRSTVLSGSPAAVERATALLAAHGTTRALPGGYAFHSDQMSAAARELPRALGSLTTGPARVPMISTVTAKSCEPAELGAEYWGRNVRETVRFADAIADLIGRGDHVFLEIGPHPVLAHPIAQTADAAGRQPAIVHSLHRDKDARTSMLTTAGSLHVLGCGIEWRRLVAADTRPVRLPLYPWQRERYWLDGLQAPGIGGAPSTAAVQDLDRWLYRPTWRREPPDVPVRRPVEAGTWLVLADRGGLGTRLAADLERKGHRTVVVEAEGTAAHADLLPVCRELAASNAWQGVVHLWTLDVPDATGQDAPAVVAAQDLSCGSFTRLIQAIAATPVAPRIAVVTRGAQPVIAGEGAAVAHAPVWGMGRVLALEHPDLRCSFIDIDPAAQDPLPSLASELLRAEHEPHVAFRDGARWSARLERLGSTPSGNLRPLDSAAAYVITGGTGALGLHLASSMIERGARHVVLVSRSGESAASRPALDQLRASGARVDVMRADVSRQVDVATLFASIDATGAQVKGIVHAAGIVDDRVLLRQDRTALEHALAPKLAGAWNLHLASRARTLDFFVLYSSVSSLLGSAGQSGYAAGNAFLDALAHARRAEGLPALSVNWGVWGGSGMAAALDDANRRRLEEAGLAVMAPRDACAALWRALEHDAAQIAVADVDWTRYFAYRGGRPAYLRDIDAATDQTEKNAAQAPALLQQLQQAPSERRRAVVLQHVKQQALAVLGVPPTHAIDNEQGLRDAGLDSLMALELKNRLQAAAGQPLPTTLAFDFPTIAAIAAFLADEVLHLETAHAAPVAAAAAAGDALDLNGITEDEAEKLLAEELAALRRGRSAAAPAAGAKGTPGYTHG